MPGLSLDCLTLLDQPGPDLVRIAGHCDFKCVSLWVQAPVLPFGTLTTPDQETGLRRALADTGVTVANLEVFNLAADHPIEQFRPALALGASLGAATATAIDYGERGADEIADRLAAFCRLAGEYGLGVNVEPISMGATATITDAAALIRKAGAPDCGIVLDMVHFVRTGGTAADIATLDRGAIRYVQLCDGPVPVAPDWIGVEAMEERMAPGEGDFPLAAILAALPEDVQLAAEVPGFRRRRDRRIGAALHAQQVFHATRTLLNSCGRPV
ncbi:sugar phosphate isomerase/epimerase family protein [Flavisphingomonas formosensis]|uniref:sugar phosphate isomerase/epimerase family protein n=1 Tax=Flavisphingomonas formosensis TaxID=861534 RepID=UPI0012FC78EE|nr:sugar phosphate isomerase/epimerase [Sphingomonas formosensis]